MKFLLQKFIEKMKLSGFYLAFFEMQTAENRIICIIQEFA